MTVSTLDPIAGIVLVATFVVVALLTMKRTAYGLAALLFVAPLPFGWSLLGTELTLSKVALVGAILGLTTYATSWKLLRERSGMRALLALTAVAIATAISIADAQYHVPVLRETLKAVEHLALVTVAYVCYRLDSDDDVLRNAFTISVLFVLGSALVELFTPAQSSLIAHGTVLPRVAGALGGPNQLGGFLEIAIAFLGAWCMERNLISSRLALALCTLVLLLTFSRGAGLAALSIVAVFFFLGPRPMRAILPIVGGALLGGAIGVVVFLHEFARQHVAGGAGIVAMSATSADYAGGVGHRSELWRAAWFFFRSHPLLGIGAGNFELELSRAGLVGVRTHANSWYLQALAEGGIALFATTIAFIVTVLTDLFRSARSAGPWVLGAFAASLALCIHQTIDYLIFYQGVGTPWMLVIGIGLAASQRSETP